MKLLVSCLGYDSGKSGISVYIRSVLKELKILASDMTLIVEDDCLADFSEFKIIKVPRFASKGIAGYLWHIFILPFIAKRYDCLLVLAGNRRFTPFGNTPKVGVVHDLSQYRVPNKYGALRMFQLFKIQPVLGRTFDKIAAISLSTKCDIEKYWKVDDDKIEVNYNGVSPAVLSDKNILSRLNLGKYILYVSRIEYPAKNHASLIKAFELLPENLKKEYKLVFVGQDWNGADFVHKLAAQSECAKNIIFTGFVNDAELSALYENASMFVFPSLAEGFGLGLAEAMSRGVPCACSNVSALDEIGDDSVLKFNPNSILEIAESIEKILSDKNLAEELSKKGLERAKIFSWKKHSEKLFKMCELEASKNNFIEIFGIKFFNSRMDDIVSILINRAKKNIKTSVGFVNTHYLNYAYENKEQRKRLSHFDYILPDGSGVRLACRILHKKYRDNLNGTDLLPHLCDACEKENLSMFFLGGRDGVARRAAENLMKMYPNLKIVGTNNGYFEDTLGIVEKINKANPDFLFIGLGAGLQEKWLLENLDALNCRVVLAVGGLCDVYSGDLFRIHPTLRKMGFEWLGRLWQEPVRLFSRYVIGNPLFIFRVFFYRFFGVCGR